MNGAVIILMERLDRVPVFIRLLGVAMYLALVAAVDLATGPDVTLGFTYGLGAMATAWMVGSRAGLAAALVAASTGFAVNVLAEREEHVRVIVVNHGLRLLSFLVLVGLTVAARSSITSLVASVRDDSMTGALTKQAFLDELGRIRRRALRTGEPIAVVYFDLDGLKDVNDHEGHAAGDALIRRFAERVGRHLRSSDPFGRLGGDEFALVLERADPRAIEVVVGRILDDPGLPAVSCGVQVFQGSYPSPPAMLAGADRRMYEEKRGRRSTSRRPS